MPGDIDTGGCGGPSESRRGGHPRQPAIRKRKTKKQTMSEPG